MSSQQSSCSRWQSMSSRTLRTVTAHSVPYISGFRPSGPARHLQRFSTCTSIPAWKAISLPMDSPLPLLSLAQWLPAREWVSEVFTGRWSLTKPLWYSVPLRHKDTELGFERLVISIITSFWLLRLTTWAVPKYIIIINWWVRVLKIWLYDMCSAISPSLLLLGNN